jgi:hypothetical protein
MKTMKTKWVIGFLLVMICGIGSVCAESTEVIRTIETNSHNGDALNVKISVGGDVFALSESLPTGWMAYNISCGQYYGVINTATNTIEYITFPNEEKTTHTCTYNLLIPYTENTGTYNINGTNYLQGTNKKTPNTPLNLTKNNINVKQIYDTIIAWGLDKKGQISMKYVVFMINTWASQ